MSTPGERCLLPGGGSAPGGDLPLVPGGVSQHAIDQTRL